MLGAMMTGGLKVDKESRGAEATCQASAARRSGAQPPEARKNIQATLFLWMRSTFASSLDDPRYLRVLQKQTT